jgi:hypothetical protein
MTKSTARVGTMAVAAAIVVAGCSSSAHHQSVSTSVVHHLDASWADGYPTMAAMTMHADVVVEGVVSSVAGRGQFHNASVNTSGAPDGAVPYTDFKFKVSATLKGSQVGNVITIRQTGGQASDGSTVEITDDPLLSTGDHAVLFLKRYAANSYFIMGGPGGRFPVTASGAVSELPNSPVTDAPRSLTTFMNRVRAGA